MSERFELPENRKSTPYFIAPAGWDSTQPNPFTPDSAYDASWVVLLIGGGEKHSPVYGRLDSGLFRCSLDRQTVDITPRVADFVRYGATHGWRVILSFPSDTDGERFVRRSLEQTPDGPVVRETDPRWVVHSTTLSAWESIEKDSCLKCARCLQSEGVEVNAVGLDDFREPSDFADYVVLAPDYAISPEHVVASHAKGSVFTDENVPYVPGVRLYFDAYRIITDGLAVRDGMHALKVRDRLPIDPYLRAAVSAADVDPEGRTSSWTPASFLKAANALFHERYADAHGEAGKP